MKTDFRLIFSCAVALGLGGALAPATAAEPATLTAIADRINIRGQATINSEVLGQMNKGDAVIVLDTVALAKPKAGDATNWLKIALPEGMPVWVNAAFVNAAEGVVSAARLNVRGGPGENFSVVGRLERGAKITEIRRKEDWVQIAPPAGSFGFVAAEFFAKPELPAVAVAPPPAVPPVAPPPPVEPPPATPPPPPTVVVEPPPVVVAPPPPVTPPAEVAPPAPLPDNAVKPPVTLPAGTKTNFVVEVEAAPKRIVTREGMVRYTAHVNVPSWYQIESLDTRKIINFLHTKDTNVVLSVLRDRRIVVIGEEGIDKRWPNTPVLTVKRPEDIHIVE